MSEGKIKNLKIRFGKFIRENLVFLFFLLMIFSSWCFARTMASYVPGRIVCPPWLPMLGDSLLPLLLMTGAFLFSSRVMAAGAVLTAIVTFCLKTAAYLFYQQAFLPFNRRTLKLIWLHTDHAALTAFLGPSYLWYMIPLILLLLTLTAFLCVQATKIFRQDFPHRKGWFRCFLTLAILSAGANLAHLIGRRADQQSIYSGHLVTPMPVLVADEITSALISHNRHLRVISPRSFALLSEMKIIRPGPGENPPPLFDRVLIIAAESLDMDFIGSGNPAMPRGITPELDKLLQEHPHMLQFYCSAQPTSWGLNALLLSRFDFDRDCEYPNMPSIFSEAEKLGFRSYYFSAVSGLFGDNRKLYQDLFKPGKQYFTEDWQRDFGIEPHCQWGISDRELFDGVLQILRHDNAPRWIALISTIDLHPSYHASGPAAGDARFAGEPFLDSLHAFDRNIGDFLRTVMADPALYNERTLIVITADHTATHGRNFLAREDFSPGRIPLIFITPKQELFRRLPEKQYASSIDLAPTLLPLMGGVTPPTMMGTSLFDGKGIAVSRTMNDILIIRMPGKAITVDLGKPMPADETERAFFEWFYSAY